MNNKDWFSKTEYHSHSKSMDFVFDFVQSLEYEGMFVVFHSRICVRFVFKFDLFEFENLEV